eukprot:12780606-Ditylum_brightwellii.AAC.1
MEDGLKQEIQYLQQRQASGFTGYLSMRSNTDASNEEHQQWHQDHDAATRIQSISRGFIH